MYFIPRRINGRERTLKLDYFLITPAAQKISIAIFYKRSIVISGGKLVGIIA